MGTPGLAPSVWLDDVTQVFDSGAESPGPSSVTDDADELVCTSRFGSVESARQSGASLSASDTAILRRRRDREAGVTLRAAPVFRAFSRPGKTPEWIRGLLDTPRPASRSYDDTHRRGWSVVPRDSYKLAPFVTVGFLYAAYCRVTCGLLAILDPDCDGFDDGRASGTGVHQRLRFTLGRTMSYDRFGAMMGAIVTIPARFLHGTVRETVGVRMRTRLDRALGTTFVVLRNLPPSTGLVSLDIHLTHPDSPFYQPLAGLR